MTRSRSSPCVSARSDYAPGRYCLLLRRERAARIARKGNRSVYQPALDTAVNYTVYDRGRLLCGDQINGPAIIEEPSSTTVLHGGDVVTVGQYGELVIEVGKR